jgi:nitroimidazol reductase NimA-like FMN-containing flavoprotein (pyridoxamine 5'-phosphate oxidase superfamily)
MTHGMIELSDAECRDLLRTTRIGRVAVVVHDCPVVLPVNYRLVETTGPVWLAIRTRPGNVMDQPLTSVGFEIDGIDEVGERGWSVLVRGTLHRVDPDAAEFRQRFDPQPWITEHRDAWLVIDPFSITGRRVESLDEDLHLFHPAAYL